MAAKKIFFTLFLLFSICATYASHIVGGELYYDCLGNNQYQITLKLYRDCFCTNCAPFGNPEYLTIFNSDGSINSQPPMAFPGSVQLGSTFSNPCLTAPSICVERAIYTTIVTLPPTTGGYDIVYQRCCRNNSVVNILIDQGATYQVHIPGSNEATCNSSPRFNNFPPIFVCLDAPLVFDHSATDPDGDQLVYSLCDPYDGGDVTCPNPIPANIGSGCPSAPPSPPYSSVTYNSPFSASDFLNSPSNTNNLRIDPQTGVLTGTPNTIGQFVVAVCVSEYRNGVFLGQMRRDFQFNVAPCNIPIANIPSTNINPQSGIGTYVLTCKNYTVTFTNTSYNPPPLANPIYYHWDFGVVGVTNDTSNQFAPTFTYPDTGSYLVRLIVVKDAGNGLSCTDTTYAYVYIYPTFSTDFTTNNICEDSLAQFTTQIVSTIGNVDVWNWNFGDGTNSTLDNPSHRFTAPGTYTVTLIGGNNLGCRDTAQKNITIYKTPQASFSFGNTCVNQPINFNNSSTGNISTIQWSFGNGANSNQQSPVYTYATTGNFDVSLFLVSPNGCKDTAVQSLVVHPSPDVSNNDTAACRGQSVQLHAAGGDVYTWSPSTGLNDSTLANPIATPLSTTTYHINAVTQFQCNADADITVTIFPLPNVTAGADTSVCLNGANFRDSVQLNASGSLSYVWSPAMSLNNAFVANPVARPLTNTTYAVMGTDANGCKASDSVIVYVLDPSLNLIIDDFKNICIYDTAYVNVVSQGASNYVWTPTQNLLNPTTYSPGFFPTVSTTYTLSVSNYCYSKSDSVQIIVLPLPALSFNNSDSICIGDSVRLLVSGAQTYQWDFDATLHPLNSANPLAIPTASTYYYVNGIDANGCKNRDSILITIVPLPIVNAGNDTLIWRDTPAVLDGYTNASTYFWNPSDYLHDYQSLYTTAQIPKTQSYVLFAQSDFGCVNSDTILITVEVNTLLMLPTAFSPNGDGVNDVFHIVRYLNISKLKTFAVFNRWGQEVFETTDISEGWDGTYKNRAQDMGVYVWQVVALTKDGLEIIRKGNVTLVR